MAYKKCCEINSFCCEFLHTNMSDFALFDDVICSFVPKFCNEFKGGLIQDWNTLVLRRWSDLTVLTVGELVMLAASLRSKMEFKVPYMTRTERWSKMCLCAISVSAAHSIHRRRKRRRKYQRELSQRECCHFTSERFFSRFSVPSNYDFDFLTSVSCSGRLVTT